jgi:hypothetical protein
MSTYTKRSFETVTVESIEDGVIRVDAGWSMCPPPAVLDRLHVGATVGVETRNLSHVVGWLIDGAWVERKSDEDLEAEHQEWLARWAQEKRDRLEANRKEWARREAALPDWVRQRLESFRASEETPGSFDLEGWGYELVIAELAAMYAESAGEDTDGVWAYAREHGTSGNQHDMAKALARAHLEGMALAGTVSALSPITGKAGY